jgi:xylulokinase
MSDYYILLDIGGTYIKSARRFINSLSAENLFITRTPSFNQSNSPKILELSTSALHVRINEHLSSQINDRDFCRGILIAGQMGGYQICDSNFQITESFVSWQDLRGTIQISNSSTTQTGHHIAYRGWTEIDKAKTGYEIRSNTPYVGITTDLNSTKKIHKNMGFVSLLLGLSRGLVTDFSPNIHITDAASSGMVDIAEGHWMKEKLPYPGSQVIFPKITRKLLPIGINTDSKGLVYTPVGDQQASLLGMNLSLDNIIFNIGTGGQVSKIVDSCDANTNTQHRPYFESKYLQTVTHLPSGRLLNAFISFIFNGDLSQTNYQKFNTWGRNIGETINFKTEEVSSLFSHFRKSGISDLEKRLLARSFFEHLANHYAEAYQLIDPNGFLQPIMGGGMGQKMSSLVSAIERKIHKKFVVSDSKETTLAGLGKLVDTLI